MTPDIAEALADILDLLNALNYHGHLDLDYIEDEDIVEAVDNLCARGDDLSEALGLVRDSSWEETAAALRALARPDVGLPEGWSTSGGAVSFGDGATVRSASSRDACVSLVVEPDGKIRWMAPPAPPAVYANLLRAAGAGP